MPNRQPRTITVEDLFGAPRRRRPAVVRRQRRVSTRILVIGMAFQVLQAVRAARPEAFTDPVTVDVDDHRLRARPR
jgi:hypothetical protein